MSADRRTHTTITLYRGWDDGGTYVWSPFVTKVEFRLRLAGVSYLTAAGSPRQAPKGKIPYVEVTKADSAKPVTLADSTLIIENMVEDGILEDMNAEFSPAEQAHDLALRALLEDKLYFYQVSVHKYSSSLLYSELNKSYPVYAQRLTVKVVREMAPELLHDAVACPRSPALPHAGHRRLPCTSNDHADAVRSRYGTVLRRGD